MQFREAFVVIQELVKAHPKLFGDVDVEIAFGEGRPCIGDWFEAPTTF